MPIDEDPNRWVRIKEFVRCINTTEPQTIKKGWEKTRLTESFDFDRELENEDAEEEVVCYSVEWRNLTWTVKVKQKAMM